MRWETRESRERYLWQGETTNHVTRAHSLIRLLARLFTLSLAQLRSFVRSFIHLTLAVESLNDIAVVIHSSIHPFIHSSIHPSIHPFIHSSIHPFICFYYMTCRSDISSHPLTRHRSIAVMGGKRREIVVPGKAKAKTKKRHGPKTAASSAQHKRSDQHKPKVQKTPVKKVRRNLFTEGSEGQEEGDCQTKVKLKVPFAKEKKHVHKQKQRRHSVAASKVVLETPCRKQLHNALWHKQHRARKRASTVTEELNVVKESPLKDIIEGENLPRRSPRRHPGSVFKRSKSFYGQNPQSCPLVRTRSFTVTIQPVSPIPKLDLQNQGETSETKSEDTNTTTLTLDTPTKNDNVKEHSIRFTPRKRNRFSLHTLLTTTEASNSRSKKSRAITPNKEEVPVRSSPRLLQKRSFSCIGFSNPSQLECLKPNENNSNSKGCTNAFTLTKSLSLTPTRSSPRLRKIDNNLSEYSKISLKNSTNVESSLRKSSSKTFTPTKNLSSTLSSTPTRASPRIRKIDSSSSNPPSRMHSSPTFKKQIVKSPVFFVSFGKEEAKADFNYSDEVEKIIDVLSNLDDGNEGELAKGNPSQNKSQELQNTEDDEEREVIFKKVKSKGKVKQSSKDDLETSHQSHNKNSPVINEAKGKRNRLQLSRSKNKQRNQSAQSSCEIVQGNMDEIYTSRHIEQGEKEEQPCDLEEDQSKEDRSNQKKNVTSRSLDSILTNIPDGAPSSSNTRSNKVFRSKSDFSGIEEPCSSSRKRLSFSPLKTSARKRTLRGTRSDEKKTVPLVEPESEQAGDSQVCSKEEKQQGHLEAASFVESNQLESNPVDGEDTTCTEPLKSCISPRTLRLTTRQHGSHLVGVQRLLSSKQAACTPPRKRKKTHAQSQNESKRSSPLNQILKQRKRNRPEALKSPRSKRIKVEDYPPIDTLAECQEPESLPLGVGELTALQIELDDCSRSSEDMTFKWFTSIAETQNSDSNVPENGMEKDPIQKGVEGSDEDDVFQGPSFSLRSKLGSLKPTTPLSAKSIQILQESPILLQNPDVSFPPGSITKRWSDPSPRGKNNGRERLKRRKHSDALAKTSSNDDEDIDNYAKSISFRQSKRLKLGSS